MRLIDKLTKRHDFHQAQANKYAELIRLLEGDDDLQKSVATRATNIADQARALHAGLNGNGHKPKKKQNKWSAAKRKANGARMRKLWRTQRAVMMAGVKKGAAARVANARVE